MEASADTVPERSDPNSQGALLAFMRGEGPSPAEQPGWTGPKQMKPATLTVRPRWEPSKAARRPAPVRAPRRVNRSSGRPRASASRPGAQSGDSGPDEPSPPGDGARRLLRRLVRAGLNPPALPHAAALVIALDEAAGREAVAA
jgi:hypothetical protein